jgi:TolB-like protein
MGEPASDMPSPEEIRAELERVAASSAFSGSPQLAAFLRFVVEAALAGNASRIKAYTIGVEVLKRDAKFDPQIDPIVRVEATRLRRTIDRYYAEHGEDSTIRIDLPRGGYVPTFSRVNTTPAAPIRLRKPALLDRLPGVRPLLAGLIAVLAIAIVAAILHRSEPAPQVVANVAPGTTRPAPPAAALPPRNGLPVVLMPVFQVSGTPGPHSISAQSLHDTLSGAFGRFDLVNIMLEPRDRQAAAEGGTVLARDLHVDYRFAGSVEYAEDGAARLLFRLIDAADDSLVWSRVFDRVPAGDNQAQEKIVRELAGTLLQPFGVIYAHQRDKVLAGTLTDPRYRCLVDVIDSFSSFDAAQQSRGRDCLEQITTRDPTFALGFSYLAALDLREYQYGIDKRPGEGPPLDRGLIDARRGVELNPASSRAYEMLFVILFARRDIAAAFDAANKSITLNRYDMRSLAAYGSRLIGVGDIDKGLAVLREAGGDGTVRPPFEDFSLFLGEYLRNDMSRAAFYADQLTNDSFQLGLIARVLMAEARDDHDAATRTLAWLFTLNPAWRDDPRGTLAKFFYAPAVVDRLANGLAAASRVAEP